MSIFLKFIIIVSKRRTKDPLNNILFIINEYLISLLKLPLESGKAPSLRILNKINFILIKPSSIN